MTGPWSSEKSAVTLGGFYQPQPEADRPLDETPTPPPSPEAPEGKATPVPVSWEFPQIHFPRISFPRISLPKLAFPTISLPQISLSFPQISLPKIALPVLAINLDGFFGGLRQFLGNFSFGAGEKVQDISSSLGYSLIEFGYRLIPGETEIANVASKVISPTSVQITWSTNHPANSKINYGETLDYGQDVRSTRRVINHELVIDNLKPNTRYFYEVMSQNKNYVYDAHHEFVTAQ